MKEEWKNWKLLRNLLILGSILAAIKLIFVDYTLDEEYQIVMSYRQLAGDTLFGTMWEPHQTSAFVCAFLMRLFIWVTGGTTGVVIFLRVCTTVIQLLLTVWVERTLCRVTEKEYAFLISICYFNIVPKIIQIPEFSNLQLWFFTIIILALARYYSLSEESEKGGWKWILLAGISMALSVLAYPADIVLFPFLLIVVLKAGKKRWRDVWLFCGTCAGCAAIWLSCVLSRVTIEEFFRNIRYIVAFDLTHELSGVQEDKLLAIAKDIGTELFLFGISFLIGMLIWQIIRKKAQDAPENMPFWLGAAVPAVVASEGIQLIYWLVFQKGYEEPQIHLLTIALLAAFSWRYADSRKKILLPCLGGGLLILVAVLYMSDLSFFYAIPHALPGILGAAIVIGFALENTLGKRKAKVWILLLLGSLAFMSVFGKGVVLRAGKTDTNTILGLGGIMREGPAAGILTNYMQAYVNDCDYEDFEAYVEEGTDCLIVTNMVGTGGTTPYMFRDLSVCHFSIVDPTSYDERLLTYWELYPEKVPEVIVVDCWYGQLMEPADNWIMQYIENDFGYTRVEEGRYVRFYFR